MPVPTEPSDPPPVGAPTPHPAESGLYSALDWYDHEASGNRHAYQALRLATIALAAAIPVLTTSHAPPLATAIVGAAIVVTEGVQQLFGFHERYVAFRSAWNALDRERRLYDSRAGRYADNPTPQQTLAERVDDLLGEETSRWAAGTRASPKPADPTG
jgi:hypothetical protein